MTKLRLNICSVGDPTSPKTWSGTPFNLYSELKKMDYLGTAFNSKAPSNKYMQRLISLIDRLHYCNSVDMQRGLLHRYFNSKKVENETIKSNTNLTLHTGTLDLPFFKLLKNQKHYLYCDSTWNLWSSFSTNMKGYKKQLLKDAERFEKKAYHQMEHIFSISEYVKKNLISHYGVLPQKITVVGTGLGVITPYVGQKKYSNGKILFAAKGRFEDKGGKLVLEAFKKALTTNPNLELIIVGQNDYTDKIKAPNIKTYGFLQIEELQNFFNECSLFLMPAINEPWGLVYLEALACKMPIVGLNRNSFPEISANGKFGFGLNEADPNKLSEILINAFSNCQKLEEMGIKGQEYCMKKFSWNNTVSIIIKTIESLEK
jgi:glycosyltransferase involved in cell wall biosynthesis